MLIVGLTSCLSEAKPVVASVKEPCENRMRKSVVASKTPGKKGVPG